MTPQREREAREVLAIAQRAHEMNERRGTEYRVGAGLVADVLGDLLAEIDRLRRLPVVQTCRQCAAVGPCSGGRHCEELVPPGQTGGPLVEIDEAPPEWCPLRGAR